MEAPPGSQPQDSLNALRQHAIAFVNEHEKKALYLMQEYIDAALLELNLEAIGGVLNSRLVRAAHHFAKDIMKIRMYQEQSISLTKYVGYLCFWIRKTSPIGAVMKRGSTDKSEGRETADINSFVALFIMKKLMVDFCREFPEQCWPSEYRKVIASHPEACSQSMNDFFTDYYFSCKHINYIRHCMSVRTFGPYHMTILADHLLHSAAAQVAATIGKSGP